MAPRLPTAKRQAELVAAALRLARDTSPALITTGDIAAAVGVTQGAVLKPGGSTSGAALALWRRHQVGPGSWEEILWAHR